MSHPDAAVDQLQRDLKRAEDRILTLETIVQRIAANALMYCGYTFICLFLCMYCILLAFAK